MLPSISVWAVENLAFSRSRPTGSPVLCVKKGLRPVSPVSLGKLILILTKLSQYESPDFNVVHEEMARQPESERLKIGIHATAFMTASFLSGEQASNSGSRPPRNRHAICSINPPMDSCLSIRYNVHARSIHRCDWAVGIQCSTQVRLK